MMLSKIFLPSAIFFLGCAAGGVAAFAGELATEISYEIVETDASGNELLVGRDVVSPGEVIQYRLTNRNQTDNEISGLTVVGRVPEGTTFVPEAMTSNIGAVFEVQAEMDPDLPGLEWSTLPAVRIVLGENGERVEEALPNEEIEMIRWRINAALEEGETALNTYRVQVN